MNIYLVSLIVVNIFCLYIAKNKTYGLWLPNKYRYNSVIGLKLLSPRIQYWSALSLTAVPMLYIGLPTLTSTLFKQGGLDKGLVINIFFVSILVCLICSVIFVDTLIKLWIKIERPATEFCPTIRPIIKKIG